MCDLEDRMHKPLQALWHCPGRNWKWPQGWQVKKKMCDLSKCVILSKNCVVLNWKSHDVVIMHFIFKNNNNHFLALYTKKI